MRLAKIWLLVMVPFLIMAGAIGLVYENSEDIVRKFSAEFVLMSEEEAFAKAGQACIRLPGKTSGCQPQSREGRLHDMFVLGASTETPESYQSAHFYSFQKEIYTRAEQLQTGLAILGWALAAAAAFALFQLLSLTFNAKRRALIVAGVKQRVPTAAVGSALKEVMDRRNLEQTQKDFNLVKSLFDNGLLSEAEFIERKSALKAKLEGADAS